MGRVITVLIVLTVGVPLIARAGGPGRERLGGDWAGAHAALERRGVGLELTYTAELLANVAGGVARETEGLANLDVTVAADLNRLLGWRGATAFVYWLGNHGGNPSDHIGDVQGVSNIEAFDTFKLYEAWLDQSIAQARASILVGLFDVNSEFDVIPEAGLFVHSSHGIGPEFSTSCRNGPSIFPTTSVAARLVIHATASLSLRTVVADGVAGDPADPAGTQVRLDDGDGALVVAEVAWSRDGAGVDEEGGGDRAGYFGKYGVGAWGYTTDFGVADTGADERPAGAYLLAEQRVFNEADDARQGLTLFVRTGVSREAGSEVDRYVGGGGVYRGVLPGASGDLAGIAVAAARPVGEDLGWEVAFEGSYGVSLTPWLTAQAFSHYIVDPGGESAVDDAVTFGLRVGMRL